MSFLFNWFKAKPAPPERVPTDTIIPLYLQDDTEIFRSFVMNLPMRFDDVLDVERLVGAFEQLLARPGWKKLGGRLRKNKDNKYEYHIPAEFTPSRPAAKVTHVTHDMSISDHDLGAQLPQVSSSITLGPDNKKLEPLLIAPDSPRKLEDWTYQDRGQFHIHIVSFTDATIVTLTWLHTLLDAMGRRAVFDAWTASLEGREIPEFYGYDVNPIEKLAESASYGDEKFMLHDKLLSGFALVRFALGYLWDIFYNRAEMARAIIIPASTFAHIRQSCLKHLETLDPSLLTLTTSETDKSNPKPFLSDGDILTAWYTRLLISSQPWIHTAPPTTTINTMNVFGLRDLLTHTEPQIIPKGAAYIGNCVSAIMTFFTLQEVLSLPLGVMAARIRKDLTIQTTRKQQTLCAMLNAKLLRESGMNPIFGDATMALAPVSNWSKAKFFETDFSAAVVGGEVKKEKRKKNRGKPTMLLPVGFAGGMYSVRNAGNVAGRDLEGNYWLSTCFTMEVWREAEKAIRGME